MAMNEITFEEVTTSFSRQQVRRLACLTGEYEIYSTALSCLISKHTEPNKLGVSPALLAFKDPMTRGILQFALRIAFRCVLHRYGNQDIHR